MRFALALILFLAAPAMAAEMVYKDGDVTVRLYETPCRVPELTAGLTEVSGGPAKGASIIVQGQEIQACWSLWGDKVLIGDVLGRGGYLMVKDFKASPGV